MDVTDDHGLKAPASSASWRSWRLSFDRRPIPIADFCILPLLCVLGDLKWLVRHSIRPQTRNPQLLRSSFFFYLLPSISVFFVIPVVITHRSIALPGSPASPRVDVPPCRSEGIQEPQRAQITQRRGPPSPRSPWLSRHRSIRRQIRKPNFAFLLLPSSFFH